MDFGFGLDGLMGSETPVITNGLASDPVTKNKLYGSTGLLRHERSGNSLFEDDWRSSKVSKSDGMLFQQRNSSLLRSNTTLFEGQQMLSFSTPLKSDSVFSDKPSEITTLPYFHLPNSALTRNSGYNSGGNMHGVFPGPRGPFTPSQFMELEHQNRILKYINSNRTVPTDMLIPIKKALDPTGLTWGYLKSNSYGWGPFQLGYSNNSDPEPGRCRRTDGKKWRCSRDAVPDQKYCERHMNRGRHRSRKPVEGQSAHSASNSKVNTNTNGSADPKTTQPQPDSTFASKDTKQAASLSMPPPPPKQQQMSYEESQSGFGHVSSYSLMNPSKNSSLRSFGPSQQTGSQHSFRQFMEEWPKNQSDRSSISWPEIDMQQSDRTQLSISIPVTASDFMSSTSSPKVTLSPLRLSREFDPIQMGLGVGNALNEPNQRQQANWIPISWEGSMGGPLGEVLNSTGECKNTSALNLLSEGWDNSPRLSPTGVLQKSAFGSLSNSSAGSSPRAAENKTDHHLI